MADVKEITYDEVLDKAVKDLEVIEPGSEDFERQAKAIAELDKARSERRKADADVEGRKGQFWLGVIQAIVGALGVATSVFGIVMQRKTNKDVMHYEEEDVITSRAFDNKNKIR